MHSPLWWVVLPCCVPQLLASLFCQDGENNHFRAWSSVELILAVHNCSPFRTSKSVVWQAIKDKIMAAKWMVMSDSRKDSITFRIILVVLASDVISLLRFVVLINLHQESNPPNGDIHGCCCVYLDKCSVHYLGDGLKLHRWWFYSTPVMVNGGDWGSFFLSWIWSMTL